jgi:glycosyltransferase involved in cell wall biosynthesis
VRRHAQPDVLVATNMWPEAHRPAYGVFVARQVHALEQAGVRCDVLYLRGYLAKRNYLVGMLRFARLTLSARRRYRLVHVHGGEMALAARFFCKRPMVVTYHGDDVLGYRGDDGPIRVPSRLRSLVIRSHANLFTATVTQSQEMHGRLSRRVRETDTVIPCGIDADEFAPIDRQVARQQLGWAETERIVLFAATRPYEPRKRIDLARSAIAHAESRVGSVRLAIAEDQAPGSMPLMMNAADCLLLTSMSEGSPVVVKEAIMCNLPVVATDVADVREMLEGVSPSVVSRHDPAELGAALASVLSPPRRSNGREQRPGLAQSVTVRKLLTVYARAGLTPRAPSPAREAVAQ